MADGDNKVLIRNTRVQRGDVGVWEREFDAMPAWIIEHFPEVEVVSVGRCADLGPIEATSGHAHTDHAICIQEDHWNPDGPTATFIHEAEHLRTSHNHGRQWRRAYQQALWNWGYPRGMRIAPKTGHLLTLEDPRAIAPGFKVATDDPPAKVAANFVGAGQSGIVVHPVEDGTPDYGGKESQLRREPLVLSDVEMHIKKDSIVELGGAKFGVASAMGIIKDSDETIPGPEHRRVRLNFETERFEDENNKEVRGADEALLIPENRQMWAKNPWLPRQERPRPYVRARGRGRVGR